MITNCFYKSIDAGKFHTRIFHFLKFGSSEKYIFFFFDGGGNDAANRSSGGVRCAQFGMAADKPIPNGYIHQAENKIAPSERGHPARAPTRRCGVIEFSRRAGLDKFDSFAL